MRRQTGEAVEYLAQQAPECAARFPMLRAGDLAESVHLVEPGGRVTRGAEAVFRALAVNARRAWLARCYERRRWFARLSECAYGWVARHRVFMSRLTRPFLRGE